MKIPVLTTVALLLAASIAQAAPLEPAHIPADAKWVIHVDFEQIRSSTLGKAVHAKMAEREKFTEKIKEATEKLGMNPAKDLLDATLYDTSYGTRKGVVLIHCNKLDQSKMVATFEKKHPDHTTDKYGDWKIYHWKAKMGRHGENPVSGAFANDNTIALCGDPEKLKKALDLISGKGEAVASDSDLLSGLPKKAMMVAHAIDVDAEYMKKTHCPVLKNCTEATVSWSEKKGTLVGQYEFTTESDEKAESFKAIVEGMKALVTLKVGEKEDLAKLVDGLKVKAKGSTFTLTYKAESEDILAAAETLKAMGKKKWGHHHHGKDGKGEKADCEECKKKDQEKKEAK